MNEQTPINIFDGEEVEGFMCLTDFECELGMAAGGNVVYPSLEDLKRSRECIPQCGVARVKVVGLEIVEPSRLTEEWEDIVNETTQVDQDRAT